MKNQRWPISAIIAFLFWMHCLMYSSTFGQATNKKTASIIKDSTLMAWLKDLYEPGVTLASDSIILNKESERLLQDQQYRAIMYPAIYKWETAIEFIQKQEIKKALWFFINLYLVNDQNKQLVVKSIVTYDKLFKMDKVLVSTFYTYILTDPEIGSIEDGHSKITAPHKMEKKLGALKEMLFYLDKYKPDSSKAETINHK